MLLNIHHRTDLRGEKLDTVEGRELKYEQYQIKKKAEKEENFLKEELQYLQTQNW